MKTLSIFLFTLWAYQVSAKPVLVLAGDSWSFLPCLFQSAHEAVSDSGLDIEINDCLETTKAGARAENYKNSKAYHSTLEQLRENKEIKAIHLSLGGNDMFRSWSKLMSPEHEDQLFEKIKQHIQQIVADFHLVRPDVFILVNGYDYGFLYDNNPIKNYREIFESMGKPTAEELAHGFFRLSAKLAQLRSQQVAYLHHYGLMHYYFGVPEAGLGPGQTPGPEHIGPPDQPLQAGGVLSARNADQAMMRIESVYVDPHHLSPTGYFYLIHHSLQHYYHRVFAK